MDMDINSPNQESGQMLDPATGRPIAPAAAPRALPGTGQEVTFSFHGSGGELFGEAIVGMILTAITFGIYAPWLLVRLQKYFYSRTKLHTANGPLELSFTGTGGLCLIEVYLRMLLLPLTLGLYMPWYVAGVLRFFVNNSVATDKDGRQYRLDFSGTGGELIVPMIVGSLLSAITFGIYIPWYECNLRRLIMAKIGIYSGNEQIGRLEFVGTGGGLIGTYLLGMILSCITFGIYVPWFQVNLNKFFMRNTGVHIGGRAYRGDFTGTGGGLLVILLSALLIPLTLGIYMFWFLVKVRRYLLANTKLIPA